VLYFFFRSFCLSIYGSVFNPSILKMFVSFYLIYLPTYLASYVSVYLSFYLFIYLSIHLSTYLSIYLFVCLLISLCSHLPLDPHAFGPICLDMPSALSVFIFVSPFPFIIHSGHSIHHLLLTTIGRLSMWGYLVL
jgi:hypothetical protein